MKKDLIENLRYSANLLGWIFGQNTGNWEGFNPDGDSLVPEVINNTTLKWTWKGDPNGTYIMFKNIRPNKVSDTVYDDPKIISSEIKDAYSSTAVNLSDVVEMDRTYSITEGSETSTVDNLGVSVALGISQSVSYGGDLYGASGTTELSIDIETSFSHEWSAGQSTERTIETSISIPPLTKTVLTATKNRSKLRQNIHYTCDLDYSIEFISWGVCKFYIESRDVLAKAFEGEYYNGLWTVNEGDDNAQNHANSIGNNMKNQSESYKGSSLPTFNTKYTKEIKFDRSVTGEVILKSYPLSYTIQAGDGFWSAANAMGITSLDVLFKNNPKYNLDYALAGGEVFYAVRR